MIIAHIAGVPVEETVPLLAGASSVVLVTRGWVMALLRRRRGRGK